MKEAIVKKICSHYLVFKLNALFWRKKTFNFELSTNDSVFSANNAFHKISPERKTK